MDKFGIDGGLGMLTTSTHAPRAAAAIHMGDRCPQVLVVDDDEVLRQLIAEFLSLAGYRVEGAPDGAEALRLLRGGMRSRVILLDRNVPVLDGPRFLNAAEDLLLGIAVIWM